MFIWRLDHHRGLNVHMAPSDPDDDIEDSGSDKDDNSDDDDGDDDAEDDDVRLDFVCAAATLPKMRILRIAQSNTAY